MDLYLITGFLGAGKTTFLRNFIRLYSQKRVYLIINEFGKAGIDGTLLQELDAVMAEINNGSIFCSCRLDQFEAVLHQAAEASPDVVLVEASGLSDPTNIRKILGNPDFSEISYRGSVCLVDACRFCRVVETARMCRKQVAVSSLALVNKVDIASEQQKEETKQLLLEINPAIALRETTFGAVLPEWLELIQPQPPLDEALTAQDITLQKACVVFHPETTLTQLKGFLTLVGEETYRMKGFIQTTEGLYLADCVSSALHLSRYEEAVPEEEVGKLVLLAGKGMQLRKSIKQAKAWYGDVIKEVQYGS